MNGEHPDVERFKAAHAALTEIMKDGYERHIELLAAVDQLYAAMDDALGELDDEAVLDAQIMLRHAESQLTRYFGM